DVDDHQRDRAHPTRALRRGRPEAGRAGGTHRRYDAERHPQGVHRSRHIHLSAAPVDATRDRPHRLRRGHAAALEPDLHLRLPHPRGWCERGAGARVHLRRRDRVRRECGLTRTRGRPVRAAALLLLRGALDAHRRGREVPGGAPHLGGAYAVESLTADIERRVHEEIAKIDSLGGALRGIENGYQMREIEDSAYRQQRAVESKEQIVVGVNAYRTEGDEQAPQLLRVDEALARRRAEEL